jgi:hypothetical protein
MDPVVEDLRLGTHRRGDLLGHLEGALQGGALVHVDHHL